MNGKQMAAGRVKRGFGGGRGGGGGGGGGGRGASGGRGGGGRGGGGNGSYAASPFEDFFSQSPFAPGKSSC